MMHAKTGIDLLLSNSWYGLKTIYMRLLLHDPSLTLLPCVRIVVVGKVIQESCIALRQTYCCIHLEIQKAFVDEIP